MNKKRGKDFFVFVCVYGRFLSINSASAIATMIITTITAAIAVYRVVAETPELVVVVDVDVVAAAAAAPTVRAVSADDGK